MHLTRNQSSSHDRWPNLGVAQLGLAHKPGGLGVGGSNPLTQIFHEKGIKMDPFRSK